MRWNCGALRMIRSVTFNTGGGYRLHTHFLVRPKMVSGRRKKIDVCSEYQTPLAKFLIENCNPCADNLRALTTVTRKEKIIDDFYNDESFIQFCARNNIKTIDRLFDWQFRQMGENPDEQLVKKIHMRKIEENQSGENYFNRLASKIMDDKQVIKIFCTNNNNFFELFN